MAEQSRLSFSLGMKGVKEMAKKRGNNEGSIFKRQNGKWRVQVSVNGKRISFGSETKAECQAWLRKMQYQYDLGRDYSIGDLTLEEYLDQWLAAHKITLRDHTIHRYKQIIRNYILPHIGNVKLIDLHLARVERFYAMLIGAGVGFRTIREVHAVLHRSLKKAVKYGYIQNNPSHGASLPRYTHAEMQVLDESQVTQLLVVSHNSIHGALYHLAVVTGLRQGELYGLKWDDLKWNSGILYVKRQVQRVPGQAWKFIEPKTRAGKRSIRLGEGSLQTLREHRDWQRAQIAAAGVRWQDYDLIFPSSVGTPLHPSNLRIVFKRTLKEAGLPQIRFHDLRHTAASLMLNHGIPVIVVSKILGHAKPNTTMDIYGHLIHEMQGEAARLMDELVTPIRMEMMRSLENIPQKGDRE
jgi:integrase